MCSPTAFTWHHVLSLPAAHPWPLAHAGTDLFFLPGVLMVLIQTGEQQLGRCPATCNTTVSPRIPQTQPLVGCDRTMSGRLPLNGQMSL